MAAQKLQEEVDWCFRNYIRVSQKSSQLTTRKRARDNYKESGITFVIAKSREGNKIGKGSKLDEVHEQKDWTGGIDQSLGATSILATMKFSDYHIQTSGSFSSTV
ncbi:hypothetical protein HYFRA_00012875 [Hymenoscyphus fraxineus]|uniref:Uncharacterized protein n=1 Tax=Hymenoscyphus fraxineus TaxID=746836 RepID=A0A9N9L4T9_9HELO|nr:hypothetical protein HYFRA_00012875 [Hymenoscyphus fraxineus]